MGIFKALVSGTLALFMTVVVLKRAMALDDVLPVEIFSCDDLLSTVYDGVGAIAIHLKGDMICTQHEVRSLLFYALPSADGCSVGLLWTAN